MGDISTWSPVDNSNTTAPPDGWPENMAPSAVNNTARAMMGAIRRWYDTVGEQTSISTPITTSTALPAGTQGYVLVSNATPINVTLPPSPTASQFLCVKDAGGNSGTHAITVLGGTSLIEGAASIVINFNYGWVRLLYTGSQWVQV